LIADWSVLSGLLVGVYAGLVLLATDVFPLPDLAATVDRARRATTSMAKPDTVPESERKSFSYYRSVAGAESDAAPDHR
jgi:hypothetical protein